MALELEHSITATRNPGRRSAGAPALALAARLHASLDVTQVIASFATALAESLSYDSFEFHHSMLGIACQAGAAPGSARHSCQYRLDLFDDDLGEVRLSRARRFAAGELQALEDLLATLMPPLRNALLYQRALRSALTDSLTGLYNRGALDAALARDIGLARRNRQSLAVILVDIDHFKTVNDSHGHAVGDTVLCSVADRLRAAVRSTDLVARFGGEEFCLLLTATDRAGAQLLAERLCQALRDNCCRHGGVAVGVTASFGVACLDRDADATALLARADGALYAAKRNGRDQVMLAD